MNPAYDGLLYKSKGRKKVHEVSIKETKLSGSLYSLKLVALSSLCSYWLVTCFVTSLVVLKILYYLLKTKNVSNSFKRESDLFTVLSVNL